MAFFSQLGVSKKKGWFNLSRSFSDHTQQYRNLPESPKDVKDERADEEEVSKYHSKQELRPASASCSAALPSPASASTPEPFGPTINRQCWMRLLKTHLHNVPLRKVCLPGTHDSGAYSLAPQAVPGNWLPDFVCNIINNKYLECLTAPLTAVGVSWSVTQGSDIHAQLQDGVRYFDMRVALVDGDFHLVHTFLGPALEPILIEIAMFLAENDHEVLLLDFNHMYGMHTAPAHERFQRLVRKHLGDFMAGPDVGLDVTFGEMLLNRKQIIAFYIPCPHCPEAIDEAVAHDFWPCTDMWVQSPWPRSPNVADLLPKLHVISAENAKRTTFFVLQAIVTPAAENIVKGLCCGAGPNTLRKLTSTVHPFVNDFLCANLSNCQCVVIVDFMPPELVDRLILSNISNTADCSINDSILRSASAPSPIGI